MMSTFFSVIPSCILVWVFSSSVAHAQTNTVELYVAQALKTNETLKLKEFQLEKALYGLQEARSMFFPSISFSAGYTKARGGRTIDFPAGDLLNPVYTTLNQLTGSNAFPQLENASIMLNPDNFYDAKFRTTLPLVNAEIWYNKAIKKQIINEQQAAINIYKRRLIKNVKEAYYRYYQASKEVEIYTAAQKLIAAHVRVNKSLYENNVINNTALLRSEVEAEKMQSLATHAQSNLDNAKMYFNFLLNAKPDDRILTDSTTDVFSEKTGSNDTASIPQREELQVLGYRKEIYTYNRKLQNAHLIPRLNTFLDLGSQAFNWDFNNKSRYYLWGVNLQWDLFASGQNKYRVRQAQTDIYYINTQAAQARKAIQMEISTARNNYTAALSSYHSSEKAVNLSERYYNNQLKVYKEGKLTYVELLDAENQLTSARLQLNIDRANINIAIAELERCTASHAL